MAFDPKIYKAGRGPTDILGGLTQMLETASAFENLMQTRENKKTGDIRQDMQTFGQILASSGNLDTLNERLENWTPIYTKSQNNPNTVLEGQLFDNIIQDKKKKVIQSDTAMQWIDNKINAPSTVEGSEEGGFWDKMPEFVKGIDDFKIAYADVRPDNPIVAGLMAEQKEVSNHLNKITTRDKNGRRVLNPNIEFSSKAGTPSEALVRDMIQYEDRINAGIEFAMQDGIISPQEYQYLWLAGTFDSEGKSLGLTTFKEQQGVVATQLLKQIPAMDKAIFDFENVDEIGVGEEIDKEKTIANLNAERKKLTDRWFSWTSTKWDEDNISSMQWKIKNDAWFDKEHKKTVEQTDINEATKHTNEYSQHLDALVKLYESNDKVALDNYYKNNQLDPNTIDKLEANPKFQDALNHYAENNAEGGWKWWNSLGNTAYEDILANPSNMASFMTVHNWGKFGYRVDKRTQKLVDSFGNQVTAESLKNNKKLNDFMAKTIKGTVESKIPIMDKNGQLNLQFLSKQADIEVYVDEFGDPILDKKTGKPYVKTHNTPAPKDAVVKKMPVKEFFKNVKSKAGGNLAGLSLYTVGSAVKAGSSIVAYSIIPSMIAKTGEVGSEFFFGVDDSELIGEILETGVVTGLLDTAIKRQFRNSVTYQTYKLASQKLAAEAIEQTARYTADKVVKETIKYAAKEASEETTKKVVETTAKKKARKHIAKSTTTKGSMKIYNSIVKKKGKAWVAKIIGKEAAKSIAKKAAISAAGATLGSIPSPYGIATIIGWGISGLSLAMTANDIKNIANELRKAYNEE